jgi:hypothetical protein
MPLRLLHDSFAATVDSAQDVQTLLELGLSLSPVSLGRARYEKTVRDLADYLYYVGAVYPDYFRPLQFEVVTASDTQLANFQLTIPAWLYLLDGAPDVCVDHLTRRLAITDVSPTLRFTLEYMLAGICTPAALAALADYARRTNSAATFEDMGFWIPPANDPAVVRFTPHRLAARAQRIENMDQSAFRHPIGLPLTEVMADATQEVITWHYCSLDLADITGLPAFDAPRIHLVSPPLDCDWTVYCTPSDDGRYTRAFLDTEASDNNGGASEMREQAVTEQDSDRGRLLLLPYDDQLIYCNSHAHLTPGVVGDVGGPPIGLYPNPHCPACEKLMFHVSTMTQDVREYGDGFRSLYICETCRLVASHATSWN